MAVNETGIYVALVDRLVRVMPADGSLRWDRTLPGEIASTAVARDRVFAGSTSNEIYAFDPIAGRSPGSSGSAVMSSASRRPTTWSSSSRSTTSCARSIAATAIRSGKRALTTRPGRHRRCSMASWRWRAPNRWRRSTARPVRRSGRSTRRTCFKDSRWSTRRPRRSPCPILAITRDGRAIDCGRSGCCSEKRPVEPLDRCPDRPC